jgi:hypothetical protein
MIITCWSSISANILTIFWCLEAFIIAASYWKYLRISFCYEYLKMHYKNKEWLKHLNRHFLLGFVIDGTIYCAEGSLTDCIDVSVLAFKSFDYICRKIILLIHNSYF